MCNYGVMINMYIGNKKSTVLCDKQRHNNLLLNHIQEKSAMKTVC